jgi:TorA maturation chaperone TorD
MSDSTPQTPAAFFHFLVQSFQYPDQTWLTTSYFDLLVSCVQHLNLDINAQLLRQHYDNSNGLEIVQTEYTRLFINAVPTVVAPPYSSVYLDTDAQLYGPSAEWVRQFYQQHGFTLTGEADIPDHLVRELEFLALLTDEGQQQAADLFLKQHFRVWFPRFKERVEANSDNDFYRLLTALVDFFTREEP